MGAERRIVQLFFLGNVMTIKFIERKQHLLSEREEILLSLRRLLLPQNLSSPLPVELVRIVLLSFPSTFAGGYENTAIAGKEEQDPEILTKK